MGLIKRLKIILSTHKRKKMSAEFPDYKCLQLDAEELEREPKASLVEKCGDESEWKLHLLAAAALERMDPEVAASLTLIPTAEETTDGQSDAGLSTSRETRIRGASEPEAIAKTVPEGDERTMIETTGPDSDGQRDLEPPVESSGLVTEVEDNHGNVSNKLRHTCFTPINVPCPKCSVSVKLRARELTVVQEPDTAAATEWVSRSPPVTSFLLKRPHSMTSGEETDEKGGETSDDDEEAEGGESSVSPPLPLGRSYQGQPHEKTRAAHEKGAAILGPGAGPHPRGPCLRCLKGNHRCVVNPDVGNGNTCFRCAKNKEKCSHQEYIDGQWIRENGNPATRQCEQCVDKASRGLPAECYQADEAHDDKYSKACSRCHMDGTKKACSLKKKPKKRIKGAAAKKEKV